MGKKTPGPSYDFAEAFFKCYALPVLTVVGILFTIGLIEKLLWQWL